MLKIDKTLKRSKVWSICFYDEPDDRALPSSFLHHTIKIPKSSRKTTSNIAALTDLDRQKTKKTIKVLRTYFTTKIKKNSTTPERLPKSVLGLDKHLNNYVFKKKNFYLWCLSRKMSIVYFPFLKFDVPKRKFLVSRDKFSWLSKF